MNAKTHVKNVDVIAHTTKNAAAEEDAAATSPERSLSKSRFPNFFDTFEKNFKSFFEFFFCCKST